MVRKKTFSVEILLILIAGIVYSFAYGCRVLYSANLSLIKDFYFWDATQAGLISTCLYATYGAGQLVNGLLCRKYNAKWIILIACLGSGACSALFALSDTYGVQLAFWMINGVFQSMFYSVLTCLASKYLSKKNIGKWMLSMGSTTAVGSLIAYGISIIFASKDFWKYSFYICGGLLILVGIMWTFMFDKIVDKLVTKYRKDNETEATFKTDTKEQKHIFLICLGFIFLLAIFTNILRDGLLNWAPDFLKTSFNLSDSLSILITMLLPIFSFFSTFLHVRLNNLTKSYPIVGAIFTLVSAIIFLVLILGGVNNLVVCSICFIIAAVMAVGTNSVITSGIGFSLKKYENAGKTGAITDSFCYLGSMLSGVALGSVIDNFGTNGYIITLMIISILSVIFFGIFSIFWKKKVDDYTREK